MKQLLAPLWDLPTRAHLRIWGGLLLLVLYLYPGNHAFFARLLFMSGPYADWAAIGWQHAAAFLLLGLAPLALARRKDGFRLGDWRFGLGATAIAMVALVVPLWINAADPAFQAEYPLARAAGDSVQSFVLWEITYLVYYVGWEGFFRGFWQLGLKDDLGIMGAMALQVGVSTVMHIGKPPGETISAIVGGVAFGLLAVRTRSMLWPLLIHWYVGGMTDLFCILRGGAS